MRALQIAFHALRTEHALVEREILPRLKTDDLVVFDLQLNAALLPAETAVGFDDLVGNAGTGVSRPGADREMRAVAVDDLQGVDWKRCHYLPPSAGASRDALQIWLWAR